MTFLIFTCAIFWAFTLNTSALAEHFMYVTSSVGEDQTELGINYHTDLADSYVNYSTSSAMSNPTKVVPTVTTWKIDQMENDAETGFPERFVCKANLTGLTPCTTYYFQVVAGSEKSEIYKTNTGTTSSTRFAWITDTQSFGTGYTQTNNLFNQIYNADKNISFVLMTGDITDRGGYQAQWDAYFSQAKALQHIPSATVPGNHEYYHSKASGYIDASIYNQFYNNPQNGITERLNSSYYFKYNNILFVMIDSMKNELFTEQRAWFEEVVTNNTYQYLIVGTHRGCITGGTYKSDADIMYRNWADLFEKHGVDLALSGHEHIFCYSNPVTAKKTDPENGVTYMIGGPGGNKGPTIPMTPYKEELAYYQIEATVGCLFQVTETSMKISLYKETGGPLHTLELPNRRLVSPLNESRFIKSVSTKVDTEAQRASLNWNDNIYGHYTSIKASGQTVSTNGTSNFELPTKLINSSLTRKFDLGACYQSNNYYYTVTFTNVDGTETVKEYTIINDETLPEPSQDTAPDPIEPVFNEGNDTATTNSDIKIFVPFANDIDGDELTYDIKVSINGRAGDYIYEPTNLVKGADGFTCTFKTDSLANRACVKVSVSDGELTTDSFSNVIKIVAPTELTCEEDPNQEKCAPTELTCEEDPNQEKCVPTELTCEEDPTQEKCKPTEEPKKGCKKKDLNAILFTFNSIAILSSAALLLKRRIK